MRTPTKNSLRGIRAGRPGITDPAEEKPTREVPGPLSFKFSERRNAMAEEERRGLNILSSTFYSGHFSG